MPPDLAIEPAPTEPPRVPEPIVPADPGQSQNLLQSLALRDQNPDPSARIPAGEALAHEASTWTLPFKSKRIVASLLTTAARDRPEDLSLLLSQDAEWGLPSTSRFEARPVFADHGEAFLAALRAAAQRFPSTAPYHTAPLPIAVQEKVRSGAEPLWAQYTNGDDAILFRFVMRGGRALIDYVGLFAVPPHARIELYGKDPSPPLTPPLLRQK